MPGRPFAIALASIALVGPLSIHIFLPLIPAVKSALEISSGTAQLMFSASLFAMSVTTLFWGAMSDRIGRRPILLLGLFLFLGGTLICVSANSAWLLLLGRLVQAVGAGAGAALVRTIARDAYGPEQLVKIIAYLTMFYTMGPMFAPIIGGGLTDVFGWRSAFVFSLLFGALITTGVYFFIWETLAPEDRNSESRSTNMGADMLSLLGHLRFTCFVLQTGFNTGVFLVMASGASFLMKETLNRPAAEFGLWFMLFPAGLFTGNFISSRIGARVANENMVLLGASITVITVLVQATALGSGFIHPLSIFLPGFFVSLSQGISMPYCQSGAITTIPHLAGTASGISILVQNLLGATFAQVFGMFASGGAIALSSVAATSAALGFAVALTAWMAWTGNGRR